MDDLDQHERSHDSSLIILLPRAPIAKPNQLIAS
jgi:hypothetical protein